jgi:hypothetical protein
MHHGITKGTVGMLQSNKCSTNKRSIIERMFGNVCSEMVVSKVPGRFLFASVTRDFVLVGTVSA